MPEGKGHCWYHNGMFLAPRHTPPQSLRYFRNRFSTPSGFHDSIPLTAAEIFRGRAGSVIREFEEVCMSWAFKTGLFDKEEQQSWGWSIPQNVYGDAWGSRSNHESSWAFTPVNSASQDPNNFFSTPGTAQGSTSWSFSSVSLATNYAFSTIPISNYGQEPIRNWGDPPGLLANTWASKIAEPARQSSWNPAPASRLRRR